MTPPRFLATLALALFTAVSAFAQQNVTVVAIDPADRLTGTVLGEWATDGNLDGWTASNVTGLAAVGGALTGDDTLTTADASVIVGPLSGGPDLDLGFNDFLQIRLKVPETYTGDVRIEYGTSTRNGFATTRRFVIPAASIVRDGAFHTYRLDLGLEVFWRDALRDLRITPLLATTGRFEIDYVEVGDVAGTAPALNLSTNFLAPLNASNTARLESKHVCIWWDPTTSFTLTHARRGLRMCEESYQVFCKKLGYNEPFREFDSTTTPRFKVNFITWYGGFWAGGFANRSHMNVGSGGLADEGWGNPVPHEFGHVIQMAQPGRMVGGHWESHANYLRAQRNLHFYDAIPGAIPAIDNLNGNSNYRPDHNRHIYADQRYYLSLDDYGTQFGLPANFAAAAWRDGPRDRTLIEKLAAVLPAGQSVKDVACECCKRWPMFDFAEKTRLRQQHWGTTAARIEHFWKQGAQLVPLHDKPGWWRVPPERAPDRWAYQMHDLTATAGTTITAELRGFDKAGTGEDWRWCFAAISAGDTVRYSPVWPPGTQSFALNAGETQVFLIVTATPDSVTLDLDSLSNVKFVDKHIDRLRYGYEVRLVNATPSPNRYAVANPSGFRTHGNGGGVLSSGAVVASGAFVGPNAKVLGNARVEGTARIEDYAVVQGNATVRGNAVVSGFALVEGNALVEGDARIRDRAHLVNGAVVRGRALVNGYTRIESTTVTDDAIVRGSAFPFAGGTISGTAILDHDYSMGSSVADGVHFSHVPWGDWWDVFYPQTLRKPRGLVASYRTSETSGEEWWDEFGALHALLRGNPSRGVGGTRIMTFDGVNDYAVLDRSLCDTPRFTFCCRVLPMNPSPSAAEPILFMGSSDTRALRLTRTPAGEAFFSISDGISTTTLTSVTPTSPWESSVPWQSWTHLAVQLDGTTARLFVNGVLHATASTALTPLSVLAANNHTAVQANFVGRDWGGALFRGNVQDARFYNVALTSAEIREEMARRDDLIGHFSPRAAMDFNGTSTTAQSGVPNSRTRTLSAWVRPHSSDDVSNYEAVFDAGNERNGGAGSGFGLDNGRWVVRLPGLGVWDTTVTATLNLWQHVALVYDGATATFFVNQRQVAFTYYTSSSDEVGKCFRIGFSQTSENVASRQFFDGEILNARIFDRRLGSIDFQLDADSDGVRDPLEAVFGSDPLDPSSLPPRYSIGGVVRNLTGTPLSGATVVFRESTGAGGVLSFTTTTNAAGEFSGPTTPGTWFVTAFGAGHNVSAARTITVGSANVGGIDFALVPSSRVSGRVTRRSDGAPISGAEVVFARLTGGGAHYTATTDAAGNYTQPVDDGTWFVRISASQFHPSVEQTLNVGGADITGIDFSIVGVGVPRTSDLLFSALTASLLPSSGSSTGPWMSYLPSGQSFATMGSPTVTIFNGAKWVNNIYGDGDGFRQGTYSAAVPINGAAIVVAVRPNRNTTGTSWTSIVDLFYNRLVLGIRNNTGLIDVHRNGSLFTSSTAIPSGQATVLSLVAQPTGQFRVFANGVQIMDVTSTSDLTSLVPNVAGGFANAFNIGRNNPDGWTVFNGLIGDVFVYRVALTTTERQQIEADLTARFVSPGNVITASASAGGSINPTGSVLVAPGASQTFTLTPQPGFALTAVTVNGTTQPLSETFTFPNVTAAQTIAASFASSAFSSWRWNNFGPNWNNAAIAGDLVDPERDGFSNLLEYALGTDPNTSAVNPLPRGSTAAGRLAITFQRAAANDITITVQGADSLAGPWTNLARSINGAPTTTLVDGVSVTETPGSPTTAVQVTDAYLQNDPARPRRFLRLEVSR